MARLRSISLRCSGCGKSYQLPDDVVGKRVRCKCGAVMKVPTPAMETPLASDDLPDELPDDLLDESIWESIAPGPAGSGPEEAKASPPESPSDDPLDESIWEVPASPEPHRREPEAAREAPGRRKRPEETPSERSPADDAAQSLEPAEKRETPHRKAVGIMAIVYGPLMVLVLLPVLARGGLMFFFTLLQVILAATLVAGGVLILKRHRLGPTVAGLSCLFLCFFPAVFDIIRVLSITTTGAIFSQFWFIFRFGSLLLARMILVYPIPIYVVIWCFREEKAIQEFEERDDFYVIRDSIRQRTLQQLEDKRRNK